MLISEEMIQECAGNADLIKQSAILEGAKIDFALKNLFKEGKDYKDLKKNVEEVIKANDLSRDNLRSKGKGLMHVCKRILQVCEDICLCYTTGVAGGQIAIGIISAGLTPVGLMIILSTIIGFVVNFIINRLFRFLWDSIEFSAIANDANDIIEDLRKQAKKSNDKKVSDKLNKEANKLEKALKKYSYKNTDKV